MHRSRHRSDHTSEPPRGPAPSGGRQGGRGAPPPPSSHAARERDLGRTLTQPFDVRSERPANDPRARGRYDARHDERRTPRSEPPHGRRPPHGANPYPSHASDDRRGTDRPRSHDERRPEDRSHRDARRDAREPRRDARSHVAHRERHPAHDERTPARPREHTSRRAGEGRDPRGDERESDRRSDDRYDARHPEHHGHHAREDHDAPPHDEERISGEARSRGRRSAGHDAHERDDRSPGGAPDRKPGEDEETPRGEADHRRPSSRAGVLYVVAALLVVVPVVTALVMTHHKSSHEETETARLKKDAAKGPPLLVTKVKASAGERTVTLPADARAVMATTLYGKTSGYLIDIRTDKGMRCKKGDILAILESPEVDQQVLAAKANLAVKLRTRERADTLSRSGVMSQQEKDQADADWQSAQAQLSGAQALAGYEVIRAPFDGMVTARYVDPGALVPAATGSTQAAMPVVDVTDLGTIRATMYLGQDVVPFVKEGDPVTLWQDAKPDAKWQAKFTRVSGALDPRSRTELVEAWFDNKAIGVAPGTYLRAELHVPGQKFPQVPAEALTTRDGTMTVAVVKDNHVHFAPIAIGDNDGRNVQVTSGLEGNEVVGLNVPSEVGEGSAVQSKNAPEQKGSTQGL